MIADMPRKLPPYVLVERDRHGKVRFYFRRGKGKRTALPNPTDRAAFEAAYNAALTGSPQRPVEAHSGSLAWLIARYKESAHFASLRPSTRRMRDNILQRVVKAEGDAPFSEIRRKHIVEAMDRRTPNAANTFRKVMVQLFRWAVSVELLESSPCDGVKSIRVNTDGFHTWTVAEVERFWKRWPVGTRERLAIDLLLFTGLRRSDVYRVGRQHVSEGTISVRTEKTGAWVHVQIGPMLQRSIDAAPTGDLAFLATAHGKPFSSGASFGNWFRVACEKAKVPGRAHGLRKAGATIAADAGASAHELMAMFGWTRLDQAEIYTRKADRRRLSAGASERIANALAPNPVPLAPNCGKIVKKNKGMEK